MEHTILVSSLMTDLFADTGWLEFQSNYLSVCVGSIDSCVYSVIGVWSVLCVQEGDTTFIVWTLHSKLDMVIHIINMVEQDVHLVFFSYADYIIHISLPPGCGNL